MNKHVLHGEDGEQYEPLVINAELVETVAAHALERGLQRLSPAEARSRAARERRARRLSLVEVVMDARAFPTLRRLSSQPQTEMTAQRLGLILARHGAAAYPPSGGSNPSHPHSSDLTQRSSSRMGSLIFGPGWATLSPVHEQHANACEARAAAPMGEPPRDASLCQFVRPGASAGSFDLEKIEQGLQLPFHPSLKSTLIKEWGATATVAVAPPASDRGVPWLGISYCKESSTRKRGAFAIQARTPNLL